MASNWDVERTKAVDMQSQLGVVRNETIYMKYPLGCLNLATIEIIHYMAISIAGSIAINLRLLLAIKQPFHLLLCFICNNNNLFFCLSCSSALCSMCSFAIPCKTANATATSRTRSFQTDQSSYDSHVRKPETCPHLVIWIRIAKL